MSTEQIIFFIIWLLVVVPSFVALVVYLFKAEKKEKDKKDKLIRELLDTLKRMEEKM